MTQYEPEHSSSHRPPPDGPETIEEGEEQAPPGVRTMALVRWILVALMALAAVASLAYYFGVFSAAGSGDAGTTQYYCPMHPSVVQDQPGECPICSMSLVPKPSAGAGSAPPPSPSMDPSHAGHRHEASDPYYCPMHPKETSNDPNARCPICGMKLDKKPQGAPQGSAPTPSPSMDPAHAGHRHEPADPYLCPMHPVETSADPSARCPICGMKLEKKPDAGISTPTAEGVPGLVPVDLTFDRTQLIGMRTAPVVRKAMASELRTVGFVTADEARIARVHARFSGWLQQLFVATTGQKVKRGQPLASIFNLELLAAQQEFLNARSWADPSASAKSDTVVAPLEQDARTRLALFGMSAAEIEQVAKSGRPLRNISVSSPISGYVTRKNAVAGVFIQPGTELFEIADLSGVWVLADFYEYELPRVEAGQPARVEVAAYPGQPFTGQVQFVYPTVDPSTRTTRLRVELKNPELKLRPGMYGNVFITLSPAEGLVVPAEALVDTGDHQYVFVAREAGRFEPRRVRVGQRTGGEVQLLDGVTEGEKIVTTGNFLIDSESRLRATIEGTAAPGGSPAAAPNPPGAGPNCETEFDRKKHPDKYQQCRACELQHRGMGNMEQDCKTAIAKPWR